MNDTDDPTDAGTAEAGSMAVFTPARSSRVGRGTLRLSLVLGVLALLAMALWRTQGRGPASFDDLVRLETLPYTQVDLRTAGNKAMATIFDLGMTHFTAGDWTAAVEQLSRADRMLRADPLGGPPEQPQFWPMLQMYLGVSQLLAGQTQESLAILDETARPEVVRPLRERGLWYGAQARLLLGDGPGALHRLDQLTGSPVYGAKAPALAAEVRKRLGG
jgi:hypothetical protein